MKSQVLFGYPIVVVLRDFFLQVRDAFALASPILRAAYDKSGRKPDMAAFTAPGAKDLRGAPAWELQSWRDRT